jgi:hypothetical protein
MLEGHDRCSRTENDITGRSLPCILNLFANKSIHPTE